VTTTITGFKFDTVKGAGQLLDLVQGLAKQQFVREDFGG